MLEHFSPAQAAALTLKMVNYTGQKMLVSLEADVPLPAIGDLTEDGLRKSEYEDYIDHLAGDVIRLAAPGSARKH